MPHRSALGRHAAFLLSLALVLGPASGAFAQRALSQVLDLNRQGMEAYNNLEIEQAVDLLNQALTAATRGSVTGAPLARTYVNLGVVSIGGLGDNGAGLDYFVHALQADASVSLDPLTATPDITAVWTLARSRAGAAGSSSGGSSGGSGGGSSGGGSSGGGSGGSGGGSSGGSSGGSTAGSGDMRHTPIPEQLAQTPVPVYVEIERAAHVYIYYRGHGMREFEREEMPRLGDGYGFEIPCADVFEPMVEYYAVAFGTDGSPLGFSGSSSAPIAVPIVSVRTEGSPALPGRAPPETCGDEECPPGMAGCTHGSAGLGSSCSRDADCESGNCDDDLCGMRREGEGGGGGGPSGPSTAGPAFFARITGGLGLSWVGTGMTADRIPCALGESMDGYPCFEIEGFPSNGFLPPGSDPTLATDLTRQLGYEAGTTGTCPLDTLTTNPDVDFTQRPWCFYVEAPGFVPNFGLRLEAGYYIHPMVAVRISGRFQPLSGRGTLAFMQIGGGVEINLTPEVSEGFHAHVHLEGGAGQIQVFLARGSNNAGAPWAVSGLGFINFGATVGYRFLRNFGLVAQPTFIFSFPQFLFTLDINLGVEVAF